MKAYVITAWKASNQPVDADQNYVFIRGRAEGFISWLLAQLKISPTVTLAVSGEKAVFSEGSLSGTSHRILPLENVCSTYFGYRKPWREALVLGFVLATTLFYAFGTVLSSVSYGFSPGAAAVGMVLGVGIAILYYVLNKTLTLGFVENSGVVNAIAFKRSIIEGQNIDETNARYVAELTQALTDARITARQLAKTT
jgi:hypothetical protein